MNNYLVFIVRKPDFGGASIAGHREFIGKQRADGVLVSAGGFADQSGGAYVIQAQTMEEANQIVQQDPMKQEDECIYTVKEWNVK